MDKDIFWSRFSLLCEKHGKKPTPTAAEMGFKASTVGMWKKGSIPSAEALVIIANFFDCTVDYLLGIIDDEQEQLISNIKRLNVIELQHMRNYICHMSFDDIDNQSKLVYASLTHIMNMYSKLPQDKKVLIDDLIKMYSND
jgi:transcriptional regulator with XRE-family HTH domain